MANPTPSSRPDPFLQILVGAASRLGLCIALHLVHGGRLADVAFPDINLVVLVLGLRWFRLSPPGSVERRQASLAIWVGSSSLTVRSAWRLVGAPTSEAGVWSLAFRLVHGGRLADVAFPDITLVVLVLGLRWFRLSLPGSLERLQARLAIWVASSSLTVGAAWGLVGPPTSETVVWSTAAFGVVGSLYLLLFY